jgi:uncharacterized protein (DUF1800 family)
MAYLDTIESTKEHPNENYGRELMELFTLGVGNYTETDVREGARAFTGWRVTAPPRPTAQQAAGLDDNQLKDLRQQLAATYDPQYQLSAKDHDSGSKTFLGQTGNWDGEDVVRIIMQQPAAGRFLVTRLFEELAYDSPDQSTVDRLVKVWDASGHSTKAIVREILASDEFNSDRAYRAKVRSPVEFVVGLWHGLELQAGFDLAAANGGRNQRTGVQYYTGMDQVLYEPPNVAGWPGGSAWLSSGTFFARLNFLDALLFPRGKALPIASLAGVAGTPKDLASAVLDRLLDGNVSDATRDGLSAHLETVKDPTERAATAAYLVAGSPEFQLI